MRNNLEGIVQLLPEANLIATSPLVRAYQTADLLKEKYKRTEVVKIKELEPDSPLKSIVSWLRKQKNKSMVIIVGHEPHLSELIAYLLTGNDTPFFTMKKGGICLLEFLGKIESGKANLVCLIPPSQLRKIGRKTEKAS